MLAVLISLIFGYSSSYAATCSAVSVTAITFTNASSGSQTSSAVITPTCSDTNAYNLGINSGLHGLSSSRYLADASNHTLAYSLRTSTNSDWGDNGISNETNPYPFAPLISSGSNPVNLFATVTIPTNTPAGIYTDTLTVVVDSVTQQRATLALSLEVINYCSISSAPTPVNFGNAPTGALGASVAAQISTIGITCSTNAAYFWGADKGNSWSGTTRQMKAATSAHFIAYNLKENNSLLGDVGMAAKGGSDTTTGINYRSATGTGVEQTYTITATITENTLPNTADAYSDIVTYTVAW